MPKEKTGIFAIQNNEGAWLFLVNPAQDEAIFNRVYISAYTDLRLAERMAHLYSGNVIPLTKP